MNCWNDGNESATEIHEPEENYSAAAAVELIGFQDDPSYAELEPDTSDPERDLLQTLEEHRERRRRISAEQRRVIERVNRKAEANRRYLNSQLQCRKVIIEDVRETYLYGWSSAPARNLKRILVTLLAVALVPPALIELPGEHGESNRSEEVF